MRIVICDDDEGCCSKLEEWLKNYGNQQGISLQVDIYNSAELLLQQMKAGICYDVIFLDIELPEASGIELGHDIRENLKDEEVNIIFISGKTKYCKDLFELEPLNYHHKPLGKNAIFRDLDKVIRRKGMRKMSIHYQEDGIPKSLLLTDILYVKTVKKKLEVTLVGGEKTISLRNTIQGLCEMCKEYPICQCHRTYMVNLNYVDRYLDRCFYMKDGTEIPVGRAYLEDIKRRWTEFDTEVM